MISERLLQFDGAQGRNRTTDTAIFNRMLYQLSYLGAEPAKSKAGKQSAGVIKARFRTVQNGAATARKSCLGSDCRAEPLL